MVGLEKQSTIKIHNKKGYQTTIPKAIAEDLLGLTNDTPKQKLTWNVEKGKVIVEKAIK